MTSVTQYKTLIMIKDKDSNEYIDKTSEISSYEKTCTGYTVMFKTTSKSYNFNYDRISVYSSPKVVKTEGTVVRVNLKIFENIDIMIDLDLYLIIFY